jgi:aminoglycoside phosphotransferase family enzyme
MRGQKDEGWLAAVPLQEKVAFLSSQRSYPGLGVPVSAKETHMSWVFMAGDHVYKLKKPVRFPYLDFSTLALREVACRAEVRLNRRLAPAVYDDVVPLRLGPAGLMLQGEGVTVDWLVRMRRIDESLTLESLLARGTVDRAQVERLCTTLVQFYRHAPRVRISGKSHLRAWRRGISYNTKILLHPSWELPVHAILRIDLALRQFLAKRPSLLSRRAQDRAIVYGHGDLRPEHIWLGEPPQIIDCLEFNAALRAVDPFDELAFLSVECERLGHRNVADLIVRMVGRGLGRNPDEDLFRFYRCYRAAIRARLAIAHLFDVPPSTFGKWRAQARAYLRIAHVEARYLLRALGRRSDRGRRPWSQ